MEHYYNKLTNFKNQRLSKIYLKGQRGARKYYDYDKLDELCFDEIYNKESDRPIKCVFTKNLRRERCMLFKINK